MKNSLASSQNSPSASLPWPAIRLSFKGDHIPSFKNCKRAIKDSYTGKMRTLTELKIKRRMEAIIQSFVLQLLSISQTLGPEICRDNSKLSVIVSLLPVADSRQWISEIHISARDVDKGFEGAELVIEQLTKEGSHDERENPAG